MGHKYFIGFGVSLSTLVLAHAACAQQRDFNLPAGPATKTIPEFARQAGVQIVAPAGQLSGVTTGPIQGARDVRAALQALLVGTGLSVASDGGSVIALRRAATSPSPPAGPRPVGDRDQSGVVVAPPAGGGQAAETTGVAEIVVTAQKRSETASRVPVAMAAISSQMLAQSGIQGTQGLQSAVPALVFTNTGAYNQPYIRGVGSRLLQNGLDPSVATYVDDRYISRQSAMAFDFADIQRVEVLKGPQGVLFGRNSSAGAIRVITNDVGDDFGGYLQGGYGNYNDRILSGVINIPLGDGVGFRLSGSTEHRDGFVHNIIPEGRYQWDDKDFNQIRGKLKWQMTPDLTARLSVGYWTRDDEDGNADVALGVLPYDTGIFKGGVTGISPDQVATNVRQPIVVKEFSTEFGLTYRMPWFDLKSITTYAKLNNALGFDGDGTSTQLVDAIVYENTYTFSQEFNITSNGDGPLQWLAGAYVFHDHTNFDVTVENSGLLISSGGLQTVTTDAVAGFGQLKWNFTKALSLTVGGRYNDETKSVDEVASPNAPVTVVSTPYSNKLNFTKFTPAVTLEYAIPVGIVYATYSQGFKSGGFNYPATGQVILKPETLDNYELGFKGHFLDHKIYLTMSAYYYDYKNLQVTRAAAAGVNPVVTTENAADATLYGLDTDATWRVTPDFTLTGSISLEHSEYKNYQASAFEYTAVATGLNVPGMVNVGFNADGHPLLRAPDFSAFASANYDFHVSGAKVPLSLSYAYKSAFDFDFIINPTSSVLRQPGYGLLTARIGYEPTNARWSLAAYVRNLADQKYFIDVVAAGSGIRGAYGDPRTYGAELKVKF